MIMRPLKLPSDLPGKLWLSPMPGRFEPWDAFLVEARQAGLAEVVCLTPWHEINSLSPEYGASLHEGTLPFRWLNLPMRNFGIADEMHDFREGIERVAARVRAGDSVLLHCAAGIGRTGTAAACVLKALGMDTMDAVQQVRDAGSNPETALQSGLIETFALKADWSPPQAPTAEGS